MNPLVLNMWLIGLSVGYAVNGVHGGAIGLAVATTLSFIISVLPSRKGW
jgi:hypothetical protein